jgi:hypothetical protein
MVELIRSNDAVFLSWLMAQLSGEDIGAVILDGHASVMEGSISAIQRRVMVSEKDLWRAKSILAEAEELNG